MYQNMSAFSKKVQKNSRHIKNDMSAYSAKEMVASAKEYGCKRKGIWLHVQRKWSHFQGKMVAGAKLFNATIGTQNATFSVKLCAIWETFAQ